MFRIFVFAFVLVVYQCQADVAIEPPQPPQVLCGQIPDDIYECLHMWNILNIISRGAGARQCKTDSLCEGIKCAFRQAGFLDGLKVDKQKVREHFDQLVKNNTLWTQAVVYLKETCLTTELPAQGVYINCPVYDIMHCALTAFVRKAQPAQWSTAAKCTYPRQFAASCPLCPSECFAPQIPNGSCNACLSLPQQPQTP